MSDKYKYPYIGLHPKTAIMLLAMDAKSGRLDDMIKEKRKKMEKQNKETTLVALKTRN